MSKVFALSAAALMVAMSAPIAQGATPAAKAQSNVGQIAQSNSSVKEVREAYERAMAKYNANDLRGALEGFNEVIRLDPKFTSAYVNRGNIKDDLGDSKGALEDYSKALSLDKQDYSAYLNRGITYSRLDRYPEAIADFNRSLAIKPDYAPAYRSRGIAKFFSTKSKEQKTAAIGDVRKAVELYRAQGEEAKAKETEGMIEKLQAALNG
jgi:tetratricopeptide (TPR) repeat protein